jgi:peptidoglycan/LPS O-acetylase OafA/YrhL
MPNVSVKSLLSPGGVRLFLAMVVVVHHSLPLRAGSWAVDVFFVLSGYWITRMWNTHYRRTRNPYITFLVSRWWRLAPVFLVCTLLGLCSAFLLREGLMSNTQTNPAWWLRQLLIVGSSDAGRILPPTWSLDVEMQFYLIAPLLIWLFAKLELPWRWVIVAVLIFALAYFLGGGGYPESARFWLFSGFFLAGLALALQNWRPRNWAFVLGPALFLVGTIILVIVPQTRSGIWLEGKAAQVVGADIPIPVASIWWTVGAVLVVPAVAASVAIRSSAFDRMLGDLAYPLYLFHWIPREWYYHFCGTNPGMVLRISLLVGDLAAALLGAILILVLIDRPMERLRHAWVESRANDLEKECPAKVEVGLEDAR